MDTTVTYRSLQPGEMLNWYRIERILGQGGFGVIYLATDTNLDHLVAVKEYRVLGSPSRADTHTANTAGISDQSALGLQRFIAEARNLVRFKHPNIVRVMSVFEANDTAYMVMEFEEGEDLREYLKDPAHITESALKTLIEPVSQGLTEVHKHGFIHRDIKPANILVRKDGSPVLLDFGSARSALPFSEDPLTALVSAGYSPLEQYSDKSDEQQGPWTDIYALGAVLYYSVSGVEPVDSAKRGSAILNGAHDPLLPARMLGRNRYSDGFLDAIDWALQFRISDRPQSLSDWLPALLPALLPDSQRDKDTYRVEMGAGQSVDAATTAPRGQSPAGVQDPLDGLSMRDHPAPREVEAARERRTNKRRISKRGLRRVFGVFLVGATIASAYALWQFRGSISTLGGNTAEVSGDKAIEPSPEILVNAAKPSPQEAAESLLAKEQAEAVKIASIEAANAQREAEQLELQKLAAQAEQQRIMALADAAAIATTKQIAAQKQAAEAAKQSEEAVAAKQREQEQLAIKAKQAAKKAAAAQALRARSRQFDSQLKQATLQLDAGQLDAAGQSLDKATALKSRDARLTALRARLRSALIDSRKPVSDADFDQVIARFDGLRRALESNDVSSLTALTAESNQNALFTQLMSRFASLDITISKIRVRNADKSITATLRIETMVRSNGDRATPSSAYRERTIVSRRKEGQWSLISW